MQKSFLIENLQSASTLLNQILSDDHFIESTYKAIDILAKAVSNNNLIMAAGNGGSMCDSMHFAEELTGRFIKDRRPLKAMSFSEPGHISCVSNDFGYEYIFSRMVEAHGSENDVFLAISTSGNSQNIIEAVKSAKAKNIKTIGLLGKTGGKLKDMCDVSLVVPTNTTERIQEIHIKLIHNFIEGIERKVFPDFYN